MRGSLAAAGTVVGLVLAACSPVGAQTCPANTPHTTGQWETLPYLMPINPISATLLHTGDILIVAGSENDAYNNTPGAESYRVALWDPTGNTQSTITVQNIDYDVFCSGVAVLPDGRPLVVGGSADYTFAGDQRSSIFNPATESFFQSQSMADGRWYATVTTLGDGRIMAFSGLDWSGATSNTVEIYDLKNAGVGWTTPVTAPFTPPLYPTMFLLPSGKVFFSGHGGGTTTRGWIFDPEPKTWAQSLPTTRDRHYGAGVLLPLLPPSYTPKVMNFGGGNPATRSTEIVNLSAATTPAWTGGPNMSAGRIEMNATLLPNGKVLASGGGVNNEDPGSATKKADLYDSGANTMSAGGTAAYSRLYHSNTLLLPDATVLSFGSNPGHRGTYEPAIERYTPPYLFDAQDRPITSARPSITGLTPAAGILNYDKPFTVTYTSTSAISAAVLMRPGSPTHTFDMEQRLVGLCGASPQPACSGAGTLNLSTPPNSNVAPPGYYMLFLLDSAGVPSTARFIQLTPYTTTPPVGVITSPSSDVTITSGGSVSFNTTSTAAKYSWIFPGGSPAWSTAKQPGNVTFSTPGRYVASLTVIDSSGNSDPSPVTRRITVNPTSPNFSIAVSPTSKTVVPGQSATFTVIVTPLAGFTGTVTLTVGSEGGLPTGISGSFSPASIGGGGGTSTLTMQTTTAATPYALSLTITGKSGSFSHAAATTLLVNLAAPASLTATPGNGQVALSWPATVGATGYHVKRSTVNGGPYVTVGCPTGTSFTDTGRTNGTTYYYVVSASFTGGVEAGGESANSPQASATPGTPTTTTTTTRPTTTTTSSTTTSTTTTRPTTTTTTTTPTTTTTSTTVPASGTCASPIVIPGNGGTFTGITQGTGALAGSCASETGSAPERVFQWIPTLSGTATLQTCGAGTTFDTVLYVRSGTCAGGELACNDDTSTCGTGDGCNTADHHGSRVTLTVTAGQAYMIAVDGYAGSCGGSSGAFSLTVTPPSPPTTTTSTTTSSTTTTLPGPGSCASPLVIPPAGGTLTGTTSGTSQLTGSCAGETGGAPETIYQWTPSTSGTASIQTCGLGTTFDTVVYVRSGTCAGGELACNDDTATCGTGDTCNTADHHGSRLTLSVTAGQTYVIAVDGYAGSCGGSSGTFALTVAPPS